MKTKKILTALLLAYGVGVNAQQLFVKGRVLDNNGEPLPGASISLKNEKKGVVADIDGNFSIQADLNSTLVVSFVGFNSKEIKVKNNKPLEVYLQGMVLDEVVVVGYGTQRRSDITSAVSSVNMSDLKNSGAAQTLEAIQGKISGVQILSNDGSMTSGLQFRIRGVNSITGGTQPLFVIDGVPQPVQQVTNASNEVSSNPLLGLNPNDIESMEVLKDASAAAIYGADGSNGVVIITTKKGKASSKPNFDLSLKTGLDVCSDNHLEVLSPEMYARKMMTHATFGNENSIAYWQDIFDNKGWNNKDYIHTWLDDILQTSEKYDLNASLSGGTKGMTYMLSLGYISSKGIIKKSDFNRFTGRLNLTQELTKKAKLYTNLSYSKSDDVNPITDWSQNGIFLGALKTSPFLYYPGFAEAQNWDNIDDLSPLNAVNDRDLKNSYQEINASIGFEYKIIDGLNFNTSYSVRQNTKDFTSNWGPKTWFGKSEQGRMELGNEKADFWVYEARLQYSKLIKKHYFSVMGAYEAKKWKQNKMSVYTTNFEDTLLGIYGIKEGLVPHSPDYTYDTNSTLSLLGRLTYTYNDKYVFNATFRRDGSSHFGENNRFGNFPSISAAWRVNQENFMKDLKFISNLRPRISFGITGNNQIPSYQALSKLYSNKAVFDDSVTEVGRIPGSVANNDLKWESSKQFNVGLDLSFFNDRLSFVADWYYKKVSDMLLEVNIPSTSGFKKAWKNSGEMENKGFELSMNSVILEKPFRWNVDFNISFNKNKVLSLGDNQYQQFFTRGINEKINNDVLLRVGYPVGIYYGYIADGVYNNESEVLNGYDGSNKQIGQLKVVDVNKDGKIDQADRVPIANVNPIHTGGLGSTMSYKGFELYAFFRWSYGNDVINGNARYLVGSTSINNILTSVYGNVWDVTTPDNNYPVYGSGKWGETVFHSELVEDGSFLKLQTLTLAYNFPESILKKIHMKNLKLSLTGTNLFTWTRYSGFDVEANTGWGTVAKLAPGLDMSPYPRAKSYMLSLNMNF